MEDSLMSRPHPNHRQLQLYLPCIPAELFVCFLVLFSSAGCLLNNRWGSWVKGRGVGRCHKNEPDSVLLFCHFFYLQNNCSSLGRAENQGFATCKDSYNKAGPEPSSTWFLGQHSFPVLPFLRHPFLRHPFCRPQEGKVLVRKTQ